MTKIYCIKKGRKTGIFNSWDDCKQYIEGYKGADFKSFKNINDAEKYMNNISENNEELHIDKLNLNENNDYVDIYIDGGCILGVKTTIGISIPDINFVCAKSIIEINDKNHTNQRAELNAVLYALKIAYSCFEIKKIKINTDSQYSIDCLNKWHLNWIKNNWINKDGEIVKNKDLIELILNYIEKK